MVYSMFSNKSWLSILSKSLSLTGFWSKEMSISFASYSSKDKVVSPKINLAPSKSVRINVEPSSIISNSKKFVVSVPNIWK